MSAQTLDLDGGGSPVVDSSTASSELAAFLDAQAQAIEADENLSGGLRASASTRRLAASLLRDGQARGARGTPRLVIGRTMVSGLAALDASLNGPHAVLTDARASLLAADCEALAMNLPSNQHDLDRALRDAFAPLTNEVEPIGSAWPNTNDQSNRVPDLMVDLQVDRSTDASRARAENLANIEELLKRARAWPSHRLSAQRLRVLVVAASPVLQLESWVEPTTRDALSDSFDRAIDRIVRGTDAESALTDLERLSTIVQAVQRTAAVKNIQLRRRAQTRLNALLAVFDNNPRRVARTCSTIDRVFRDATDDHVLTREKLLPTFTRVAWRDAQSSYKTTCERLINSILEAMTANNPMTEPALLSAIRARRQTHDFLHDIADIGAFLTGINDSDESVRGRPTVLKEHRRLAARVLELGKQLAEPNEREDAMLRLRTIAALVRATQPFTHETELLSGGSGHSIPLQPQVVTALADFHSEAGQALKLPQPAAPESGSSRIIDQAKRWRTLIGAIHAHRSLSTSGQRRLQAWAPWELTEHGWAMLLNDLPDRLESATRAVLNGTPIDEDAFTVVHLAGMCIARLESHKAVADETASLLAQVAKGTPPPGSFGAIDREPIASICRDLEEMASAVLRGESERVASLRDRSTRTALQIIERMQAEQR